MEEDLTIPRDAVKNCSISVIEDEKEKVKDFVYKHFREGTDGVFFTSSEEPPLKEHGSSTKEEKQSPNRAHLKYQQRAVFSGKILSFGCSVCKDSSTYSPNDLLKHFRVTHKGTLPTYPCDLCGFITNEFPSLQRHRIEHRNTLVTCELCNDGVPYSLHLLTRHYIISHSVNGQFHCDWCEFTTVDAGTYVQHIHHHNESPWKCSRCIHISLNEEDHRKHMKAHKGTFPFTCQVCGFGAVTSELLKKHAAAVHKEEPERRNTWTAVEETGTPANSCESARPLLKKSCESQETQRISKRMSLSGSLPNLNGKFMKPDEALEETYRFVDGTTAKADKHCGKSSHNVEQSTVDQVCDGSASSDAGNHSSPNGLTVLMVKNKISIPPNCTTKVMGFKIVDGKKHLVLKVIPTAKQDVCAPNHSSTDEECGPAADAATDRSKVLVENGECSDNDTTSHSSPTNDSCIQAEDIVAVKVKIEEEETSVCNFGDDGVEESSQSRNGSASSAADAFNEMSHISDPSHSHQTAGLEVGRLDEEPHLASSDTLNGCDGHVNSFPSTSDVVQELVFKTPGRKLDTESKTERWLLNPSGQTKAADQSAPITQENPYRKRSEKWKSLSTKLVTPSKSAPLTAGNHREGATGSEGFPNQEVFVFHNYSKETFSSNSTPSAEKDNMFASHQLSLEMAESCGPLPDDEEDPVQGERREAQNGLVESDLEAESTASTNDPSTEDENPESVLQHFNIIKVEEENIPISKQPEEKPSSTSSVEDPPNAGVTKQLNQERVGPSSASSDSPKQPKKTVRILQLPEGKQPLLLTTADSHFAKPMQVKATPGFKLITNSTNPQINVSYLKSGIDRSSKSTGIALNQKSRTIGVSPPKAGTVEKGTLLSATHNHYLINSPGLKGPVLLSSTPHSSTDKTSKTNCYLLQRSVPFPQVPSTPALRLSNSQLPLNSRPVLAMPVSSVDKTNGLQTGRQAFLLRYISPPKSTLLLNNQESKNTSKCSQSAESNGSKVILKIVTPSGNLLTSGAPAPSGQPLFLATRPQTQCILVSSNKTNGNASNGVQKMITVQSNAQKPVKESPSRLTPKDKPSDTDKPVLAPRPIRPPSQRKRRRKALFDELPTAAHKARRVTNKALSDKDTSELWRPVAKEMERTLRLSPFTSLQQIKCPRRYQPVVVLNHPDADIPEVANIMKIVNRYRGAVTKVSLSQKTIQALSDFSAFRDKSSTKGDCPRHRPVQSSVRERFLLKLKLRKKSKKKYEVVETLSGLRQEAVVFECWFCGRLFNSQEDWIGHGQRHLMEATRDWNKLF